MEFEAVILSGGESSRMGSDKGLIEINGKPMVEHIIGTLKPIAHSLWVSTANKNYIQFGVSLVADEYTAIGPLGGLHTALKRAISDCLLVVSVDAPFVSEECILKLIRHSESDTIAISKCEGKSYPLIGVYPISVLAKLEEYIECGKRSVFGFLETQKVKEVEFSEQYKGCFRNINTPEDLKEIQE